MCITPLFLEIISHYLFQYFGIIPSYCLHYRRFFLYGLGQYIQWGCASLHSVFGLACITHWLLFSFKWIRVCYPCMTYLESGQCNFLFLFVFLNLCFHSPSVGLVFNYSLFSLLFQCCCLCCSMYLFIFILKFVCGILNFFSVVKFRVDLTALSAWPFPLMSVWLGTQHICLSLSFDKFFNSQIILIINGWSNFLFFSDSNTDSESEKNDEFFISWFWDEVKSHNLIFLMQVSLGIRKVLVNR